MRILLVPAPELDLASGELVALRFADAGCRPGAILARDDYEDRLSFHQGDNGAVRRCVSEPVRLQDWPEVLIRYAGDPADAGIRVGLDLDSDTEIDIPLALGRAARHGWLMSIAPLPAQVRRQTVAFVVDDRSRQPDGWVTLRDVVQIAGHGRGLTGVQPFTGALTGLCMAVLGAGILWFGRRRDAVTTVVGLAALLAVEFLQTSSFYLRDDYVLLSTFSDGIRWQELVAYYDQLMPLFLMVYAGAVAMVGPWYAPLQVAMLAGHVLVSLILLRLLERHGFARWLSLSLCLLFATAWSHIEVVPWFIAGSFLLPAGLTLLALERTIARVQGQRRALASAVAAAALAPLAFAGGAVAPWLCLAYVALFARHDRRAAFVFVVTGVATVALILSSTTAVDSARVVAGGASVAEMLRFIADGAVASSLASLLALRDHWRIAGLVMAAFGAIALTCSADRVPSSWTWRSLAFGVIWMAAAYVLQAAVRTNTIYGNAMSFRYTYFGMMGAAFVVAAWLQPLHGDRRPSRERLRRAGIAVWLAATVAGVTLNAANLNVRSDAHEREYFDISRQYFAVTRSALAWAEARQLPEPPGIVPKSVFPYVPGATPLTLTGQFRAIVCHLSGCPGFSTVQQEQPASTDRRMQAIWDALLFP